MKSFGHCGNFIITALIFCFLIHNAYSYMSKQQIMSAMKTLRNMCVQKSGATKEALENMNNGVFDDNDRKLKCYIGCVMNMMQAVKGTKISLKMIKNQVAKMLEPEIGKRVVAAFEGCIETTGADQCELAYNYARCLYDTDKEVFMIP